MLKRAVINAVEIEKEIFKLIDELPEGEKLNALQIWIYCLDTLEHTGDHKLFDMRVDRFKKSMVENRVNELAVNWRVNL